MTYSESAEGITISKARAMQELRNHGCVMDAQTEAEFVAECGDKAEYLASDVLAFLGY